MRIFETSSYTPPPVGTYAARLSKIIDLGKQVSTFSGTTKIIRQIVLTFQLPGELNDFGRPYHLSKTCTVSMHARATFRDIAESLLGQAIPQDTLKAGFDPFTLLGLAALVSVEHTTRPDGSTSARVAGVMPLAKGMRAPELIGETSMFSLEDYDEQAFQELPEWAKDKIRLSPTYRATVLGEAETADDPLPF